MLDNLFHILVGKTKALLVKIPQEVHKLANNAKKHPIVQPRREERGEKSWIKNHFPKQAEA